MAMRTGRGLDVLSLGSFVVLGLPDGMLGTAWPSMRQSFGAPIADLGLILLVIAAGMMDGGLNTAIGLSGRPRLLNLLHAAYGVGTTIGPLLITVALLLSS